MNLYSWLALASYSLVFLIVVTFALVYLRRSDFLPYHSIATARTWDQLDSRMQLLIMALIKVAGWAWLALAIAGFSLLYLLFTGNAAVTQLVMFQVFCLVAVTPPVAIAIYVRNKTAAPTPIRSGSLVVVLTLLGFTFALLSEFYP
ncbi:hypothetical protein [Pseudomonas mandelii]|uniref:hypothetical protein n=1 Tax=Pseudomonas mandelii TaxID=75612 RepID=UPI00224A9228|nr:hypothetical protein [Pseudomonas mandelii]MCX2901050.1 hypothetical protein [Pseudomonas mandelii]